MQMIRPIYRHDHLSPTQRGWLFLGNHGGPCDKACKMCYYTFQQNLVFFSLDTLMARANLFRHLYHLGYCDISGGEATIFGPKENGRRPHLEALIRHCATIGLKPTIITHGQNNTAELVKGVEDAGLEDWLISLHGLRNGHERTVVGHNGKGDGGFERLVDNLGHAKRPVRFNTTIQNFNYHELPDLARWLRDNAQPTVWNMIEFNPFFAWDERPDIDFQSKKTEIAPFIAEAVQIAEGAGWEVNVRYFAPCIAAEYGFEKNCIGFYQTQLDPWEWSLCATNRTPAADMQKHGGQHAANMAHCHAIAETRANPVCESCRFFKGACEGIAPQYQRRYGLDELKPSWGEHVSDPAYFEKGGTVYARENLVSA